MTDTRTDSADYAATRAALNQSHHAPGEIYTSPEIFRREAEVYFMREWLFVARVEELANPGDYHTLRVVGEPIIIARDKGGELHACYNMCVHRGVEVASGSGNTRSFKCPYHGWVYGLDGALTGAAYMGDTEGFDLKSCRLRPLRLEVWRGNIFVNFDAEARPLVEAIEAFETDFAFLGMEKCRLGNRMVMELDCNWKFVHENLMDFYHVNVLHANTFGANFAWQDENVHARSDGGLSIFYDAGPPTPGAEPLLGKMPWLEDRPHSFACTGYLPPNLTIFGRIDCIRPMVSWPIDEAHTQVIIYHLFPESFFDRPDIEETLKIYHDYQLEVLEEDRSMLVSMQAAMNSPAYKPGRLSVLERPLHNFLNGYLDRIIGGNGREAAE